MNELLRSSYSASTLRLSRNVGSAYSSVASMVGEIEEFAIATKYGPVWLRSRSKWMTLTHVRPSVQCCEHINTRTHCYSYRNRCRNHIQIIRHTSWTERLRF